MLKEKKVKILYTIPNFDTAGSGKALLNLALGLDKTKFDVEILCLNEKGNFFKVVKDSGIPIHVFNYIPKERPIFKMVINCWKVSRRVKDISPDIVHSFHYNSNYTEALSTKMGGIKWVFTKKSMSWGGSSKNSWKLRSWLADKIVIQNTDMKREFYSKNDKTVLIPRGVVTHNFQPSIPDFGIRLAMHTKDSERVIICVANFVPVKSIETLIDAFDKVHLNFPNWKLWLVGDCENEYGHKIKDIVCRKSLSHKIIFSGKTSSVIEYLNHAELFVLPTKNDGRREGSPVALLEAMANGKVVLGSNIAGIKDQLIDFPFHLFQPNDTLELAAKMKHFMMKSIEENKKNGLLFLKTVNENFTIQHEVYKHETLYLSLIKSNQ